MAESDAAKEARIAALMETIRQQEVREALLRAQLAPERDPKLPPALTILPGTHRSEDEYLHFRNNMDLAMEGMKAGNDLDRRKCVHLLANISADISKLIREAAQAMSYAGCIVALNSLYVRESNSIMARSDLYARQQEADEDIDKFVSELTIIADKCQFQVFETAIAYRNDQLKTSFLKNLKSDEIRYQLLQEKNLTWDSAVSKARDLERAKKNATLAVRRPSEAFALYEPAQGAVDNAPIDNVAAMGAGPRFNNYSNSRNPDQRFNFVPRTPNPNRIPFQNFNSNGFNSNSFNSNGFNFRSPNSGSGYRGPNPGSLVKCKFCGFSHQKGRDFCPAKFAFCWDCSGSGHFRKSCPLKSDANSGKSNAQLNVARLYLANSGINLIWVEVMLRGKSVRGLLDTGASKNFVSEKFWSENKAPELFRPELHEVEFANGKLVRSVGVCVISMCLMNGSTNLVYPEVEFVILKDLCAPVILGGEFLRQHKEVIFDFGGPLESLKIKNLNKVTSPYVQCSVSAIRLEAPSPFASLAPGLVPVECPSRHYSAEDIEVIRSEIKRLLEFAQSDKRPFCILCKMGERLLRENLSITGSGVSIVNGGYRCY